MTALLLVLSCFACALSAVAAIPQIQTGYTTGERAGWIGWFVICCSIAVGDFAVLLLVRPW